MKRLLLVGWLGLIPLFLGSQGRERVPWIQTTLVSMSTANAFPVPPDRSVCLVFRAIVQSQGIDYDTVDGNIVFKVPLNPGSATINPDVIELVCF
jgi:hypothetical protein